MMFAPLAPTKMLGEELRRRAELAELTQSEVARKAKLGRTEINKVFAGNYKKATHYDAVARVFGTTARAVSATLLRAQRPDIAPRAHVICVSSLKGGTCKTGTALHLAGGFARLGARVLLVDLDDSCQIIHWIGNDLDPNTYEGVTLSDVLQRKEFERRQAGIEDVVVPSLIEGIDLVRSDDSIKDLDIIWARQSGVGKRLYRALEPVRSTYDVIILDTAPTMDRRLSNALLAADSLLIPTKVSAGDLDRLEKFFPELLEFASDPDLNPDLGLLGVLLCDVDSVGPFEREFRKYLTGLVGDSVFEQHIGHYKAFTELQSHQELIYTFKPERGRDYMRVVNECVQRMGLTEAAWEVSA